MKLLLLLAALLICYLCYIKSKKTNKFEVRPWGRFDILLDDNCCKVKKITVAPGKRLSYQQHQMREEYWTITQGNATVTVDDHTKLYKPGDVIHIPIKAKHRIGNNSDMPLIFIEIQRGSYFGEDDIKRFEDDFGRS